MTTPPQEIEREAHTMGNGLAARLADSLALDRTLIEAFLPVDMQVLACLSARADVAEGSDDIRVEALTQVDGQPLRTLVSIRIEHDTPTPDVARSYRSRGKRRLEADEIDVHVTSALAPGHRLATIEAAGVASGLSWDTIVSFETVSDRLFADQHDRVACRFVVKGEHKGQFQGLPPSGRRFELPGITILRFDGDRCVERWSQADFLSLLQQLGALPTA